MGAGRTPEMSRVGRRYGMLVVTGYAGGAYWTCRCDCGRECRSWVSQLTSGKKKDCGCLWAKRRVKHGLSRTAEKNVHTMMLQRCYNPKHDSYKDYGGRGIRVCGRWRGRNGLVNFVADMGRRPSPKHKLDRKDNDGPYSPENCRWATEPQQQRNTSRNVNVTWDGRTMCLKDWAKEIGIGYQTLVYRVRTWGLEKAMTTAVKRKKPAGFIDH